MPGNRKADDQPKAQAPVMDPELQLQILRDLTHSLAEEPNINEVCELVIEGIHRAIGMQRVALLMADRDGQTLVPRKLSGRGTERWRDHLTIAKNGSGILGGLLPENGCFIYRPGTTPGSVNYDRWLGRVPALIGPLRAGNRLVGLFYADNAAGDYTLRATADGVRTLHPERPAVPDPDGRPLGGVRAHTVWLRAELDRWGHPSASRPRAPG